MPSVVLSQLAHFGPERCEVLDYERASAFAQDLVRAQYENFSVVSRLLPRELRDDFAHVYAFCRWADDLGDEVASPQEGLRLLAWWRDELDLCYAGRPRHPVYVALRRTIEKFDIPRQPFDDLIDAFVQDQTVRRYDTWAQVVDYCTRSADPVGRLVLYMLGPRNHRDAERQRLSDRTCTALQLVNFWQDVRRDVVERDRIYIPREIAHRHGLDLELMAKVIRIDAAAPEKTECRACPMPAGLHAILPAYQATVRELMQLTRPMFEEGKALWPLLDRRYRGQIKLFTWGGEAIAAMIERRGYDTLTKRPSLSKAAKLKLVARAMANLPRLPGVPGVGR